jgi:predicted TIM-barrel fold metal-dependent hydrolase
LSIFDEPKIDGHCHILDPLRFAYGADIPYKPAGQEMGDANYFAQLMDAYGVRHALLVGPNSGYGADNSCMLDALARFGNRFKGIAVVASECSLSELEELQSRGVIGIAFNVALHGLDYYSDIEPLLHRLKELGMFAQFQVEGDLLCDLLALIERTGVRVLIDHCGRPILANRTEQAGFQALLALASAGKTSVKISGFAKFSRVGYPFTDTDPYVDMLIDAFTLEQCVWASDWPYLKAPYRVDYGPMLKWVEQRFTSDERRKLLWSTPARLFGFEI